MDKYKQNSTFDKYYKKLSFFQALQMFLHAINEEKESLRDIDTTFVSKEIQKEIRIDSISYF